MIKKIDLNQLKELLNSNEPNVKLVDVLAESHYEEEHIKGAISLPAGKIEKYAEETFDKDDKIIVYCASTECQASAQAAEMLDSMGYQNVYDYEEGLKGYKEKGMPLEGSNYETAKSHK